MLETLEKVTEIAKKFVDSDLVIIVNDKKIEVFEKGNLVKGVKAIDFSGSIDSVPEITIQKVVI